MAEDICNTERAEYETPALTVHGSVGELTQGTAGQVGDTAGASQPLP
jgi:hypothetical protein